MEVNAYYITLLFTLILYFINDASCLDCYQCDSATDPDCQEDFDHSDIKTLSVKSKPCKVYQAGYCVKTTGVWGGVVGTTRFCSSRDMSAQCQFIRYPDHDRVYRACIYTCTGAHCNSAPSLEVTSSVKIASLLTAAVLAMYLA